MEVGAEPFRKNTKAEAPTAINRLLKNNPVFRYLRQSNQPSRVMEATFTLNPGEANPQLIGQMLRLFADSDEPVTIRVSTPPKPAFDFQTWFQGMEAIRAVTEKTPLPPGVDDVDALIDEMNEVES